MSYQIITRITITSDPGVMVRMAANNIRPLDFRYDEVVSLTETLRTKGRPTLELELLSLFFKGKTHTHRLSKNYIRIDSYRTAWKWDGQPLRCSWYA